MKNHGAHNNLKITSHFQVIKEHVKVKEETSTDPSRTSESPNKLKKVYTLAVEQTWSERKTKLETERTKKNLRKSRLRSELESALRKEKSQSKRNNTVSWSEQDNEDSDLKTPTKKRRAITRSKTKVKQKEKHPKRSVSTFSSEQNQDDFWSEQDWGQDSSTNSDASSRNVDSTNNSNKKSKRETSRKFKTAAIELRPDSSRNFNSNDTLRNFNSKNIPNLNMARQEDEFYFFGQSMAAQLRRLPINVALDLQVQFQNELTKARTKCLSASESVVISSTSVEKNPLEDYEVTVILPSKTELDDSD